MSLTHYAPDLPSFIVAPGSAQLPAAASVTPSSPSFTIATAVVLDYGGRFVHLRRTAQAYRDLSPAADAIEAATNVFEALRWAETHKANGASCVLLPNVDEPAAPVPVKAPADASDTAEHAPALSDRLYRAASGRSAHLTEDSTGIIVADESAD